LRLGYGSTKEGLVSNSKRCKTKVEAPPIVSKSRRTQRRLQARLEGHPLRVKATKLARRQFLHLAAGSAAIPAVSQIAGAQTYPARPVRIIVGFAAGGSTDLYARLMGQRLSERLGQPFIIDNRPGAGSNIGTEVAANAAPDGYTLLMVTNTNAINVTLYDKLNFNFIRDITPVARVAYTPLVVVVNLAVPAKTVPEFIAYAKANPGKLNIGSAGIGTPQHVAGELFKMMAGVNMVQLQYRGSAPAIADLLGGQVQVMFPSMAESIEYIRAGAIRALAVTSASRSDALPDLPILADFVPGFEASAWFGVGAPRNTPTEIVDKLNKEINAGLIDPKIKALFAELGGIVLPGSPADFRNLIVEETEKWAKVIRELNIKL
jgi:tripartite-type tricarboxylate transporter receptor subunit TctC